METLIRNARKSEKLVNSSGEKFVTPAAALKLSHKCHRLMMDDPDNRTNVSKKNNIVARERRSRDRVIIGRIQN